MSIKKRIEYLVNILNEHSYKYYILNEASISDTEYDTLYNELISLEKAHPQYILEYSPSQKVGSSPQIDFKKIAHSQAMLSLSNIYTFKELEDYHNRLLKELAEKNLEYLVDLKLDGLAISIIYKKGIYNTAITRGDGYNGEDVTMNVKTIKNIPLKLNKDLDIEIRGEILISKLDFETLNKDRIKNLEKPFSNARNLASGSIRQLNPKITAARPLKFYAHSFTNTINAKTYSEALEIAEKLGFQTYKPKLISSDLNEIKKFFDEIIKNRANLDLNIDGIVIKLNNIKQQLQLGNIAKAPKWALAWKPSADLGITKIINISIQIGRTGIATPVAELEEINIGGVNIKRASLHNASELERKDIRIGDFVKVQRAGDVIPYVVEVDLSKRNDSLKKYIFPAHCPVCTSLLEKDNINYSCINKDCPGILKEKFKHFVKALNIDGLGIKFIEKLILNKLIKKFSDIYKLDFETINLLDRTGVKSTNKILKAIAESKNTSLDKFIFSLGIEAVGLETAKELAKHLKTKENLINGTINYDRIISLANIGPSIANNIVNYFNTKENIDEIQDLYKLGFNFTEDNIIISNKLSDLTFVITGTFNDYPRAALKKIIEENGAKLSNVVSKNTSYLLLGENSGSKLNEAQKLNIKIISLEDLFKLI